MYALATIPLIRNSVNKCCMLMMLENFTSYANGSNLRFGYFTNVSKTWLVTKEHHLAAAAAALADIDVKVTSDGRPYLGVSLDKEEYIQCFLSIKVQQWAGTVGNDCAQPAPSCTCSIHSWDD